MTRFDIFEAIAAERERQESLALAGRFAHTAASDQATDPQRLAMIAEEVGEVAGVVLARVGAAHDRAFEDTTAALRAELVHVAAIAVAWLESLPAPRQPDTFA